MESALPVVEVEGSASAPGTGIGSPLQRVLLVVCTGARKAARGNDSHLERASAEERGWLHYASTTAGSNRRLLTVFAPEVGLALR
jgi:hypothetical protein